MWGPFQQRDHPGLRVLDYAELASSCLCVVPRVFLFLADVDPPGPWRHAIIITISRTAGAQLCLAAIVHSRRACSHPRLPRDPSYRSMIYGMPGGNPEKTLRTIPRPSPAQPASPAQAGADLHLQVTPEDPGFPFVSVSGVFR